MSDARPPERARPTFGREARFGGGQALSALRGKVQTVLGAVEPDVLGPTLMHEHVLCDLTPPELAAQGLPEVEIRLDNVFEIRHHWCRHPGNHVLADREIAIDELARFRDAGGSALVELTCEGIAPDRAGLADIARRTGLHIVAGSGPYTEAYLGPSQRGRSVAELRATMVRDVLEGVDDSGARAGILGEIGLSTPFTDVERRALVAGAEAQTATGAAINIHPPRNLEGTLDAIAVLRAAGADIERVIVSHIDRTLFSLDDMQRLADTGAVLEFDFFGIESAYYPFADVDLPNDGQRIRYIAELARRGYVRQVVVGQDICTRTRLRRFGGHGYAHLLENATPLMLRRGLTDEDVRQMLVLTPRRLLAFA
jgi:phosphotriesterase-related protein